NDGDKVRFLYLGSLVPAKGLPLLLDVWRENEFNERAELWMIGSATNFALKQMENVKGIKYKGKVPRAHLPTLLRQCDCLIFPSFFEGFGQVILEAMAAGLTVITTDATAGPDIIEHEKEGFLISVGDRKQLSSYMDVLIRDRSLTKNMGKLSKEKARSFSWNAYGDRWKKILLSI
ncbi:MAG TPA: glycosyltransferase family 4 protein, partial [Cyclobacteriaceae bacterium]|nr:glycosyltransferase family 4 protein [Cyclobacteriaceae bacterium]